jgi:rhodanese-related sulfurtransferase
LPARIGELRRFDNAEIVVYCESGLRAAKAADMLIGDGFLNIRHLQGDMRQWREDGLPTQSGS